jgi:ABC-type multidrug transport system ATPase subunit
MTFTIENLKKKYRKGPWALKGINLQIDKGVFGLLGPNGAGKTTMMRIVATLLEPTEGKVHFDGIDVLKERDKLRKVLGYLPQEYGLYPSLTALEFLDYIACLKGIADRRKAVDQALNHVHLEERKRRIGTFSGGMKQRVALSQALLGSPKLLIVDEPTAGLDPQERLSFKNLLAELGEQMVIVLSTHIVADVLNLCKRIALIREGNIIVDDDPMKLVKSMAGKVWEMTIQKENLAKVEKEILVVSKIPEQEKVKIRFISESPAAELKPQQVEANLEDAYVSFIAMRNNAISE